MNSSGTTSNFGITARDVFSLPQAGLSAIYVNLCTDALYKIESWASGCIQVIGAESPALSPVIQTWQYTHASGTVASPKVRFTLSPVFLEDSGAVKTQKSSPAQAQVSLSKSLSLGVPSYTPVINGRPPWAGNLKEAQVSVRLLGATGTQTLAATLPEFYDTGTGVSNVMETLIYFNHPSLYGQYIPAGVYEVSLIVLAYNR